MSYIELHARSTFSFLRAGSAPEELVRQAAHLGLPQLALCDRDGFQGSVRQHMKGLEAGVRALVGSEITMEDGTVVPLLVATREGYRGLSRLITTAQLRAPKGASRVRWDELAESSAGLFALTGDEEGPVLSGWRASGPAGAEAGCERLRRIFGCDRLFVEIQRHQRRGEERAGDALRDLAGAKGLPLLATNGVRYATPGARAALDAFTCIRHHTHLDAAGRLLEANAERHLKDARTMAGLFADLPEAVRNTERLAGRLEFGLENLGYEFPTFPVAAGETMDSFLRQRVEEGARERYGSDFSPAVRAQLERELALIGKLGFAGYFLIVWDICRFCRDHDILVQGRGSAANSVVCYALRITAVDPIKQQLLFERFLNEGQSSWPDIDLDLPSGERRERTIQEIYRRYAPRGAAMTANVITYRGRSAVREIGKVLHLPDNITDRFSSLYANGDFPETLDLKEQLRLAGLPASHPRLPALLSLYGKIRGQPRHLGQHSGGMIICRGQLDSVVPLENATMPGRVVAQWDKDDCADLGIVKVDFLGLGMMAALQDSLRLCARRGRPVDLARIPHDDPATFALLQRADTIGVFQVESRAQMATLPRLKPKSFYDVAVQVAIVRPGPIHGEAVNPYLQRRAGQQAVTYLDERLRPILGRTLGVVLFQEQILQIAMVLGNFTGTEASELRRAIDFKRSAERLKKMTAKLRAAMAGNDVSAEASDYVLKSIATFALYGFPESHALSFALIAYASSWLKVHRPAEFYAGLINNLPMGFYSAATLVQDARRHGIRVRPPCCAASAWETTVEADDILRIGLHRVKGLRESAARRLLAARAERPFASMPDFLARAGLDPAARRALATAGALNAFAPHRRAALWQVEEAPRPDDLLAAVAPEDGDLSPLEAMTHLERIAADYATLSLTAGDHPMKAIRPSLAGMLRTSDLIGAPNGAWVTVAGSVICRQRPGTAKGFVFVSLEDETGVANAVVRPALFEHRRLVITQEPALVISGRLQSHDGVVHLKAEQVRALTRAEVPAGASHDFK
ncbi:MAG TPA: error-prone DNA polymerase [Opitutaceae bacterium]|nr:error-prone DNA polymerase [Opitutaceae bacterium]